MKRILIVDDEEDIRSIVTQMLEYEGYEVHAAENGEQGMRIVQQYGFDLIITDMIMPNKSGLEFIMELKRDYPDVKVVAISGGGAIAAERYLRTAEYLGDIATLKKPFQHQELLALVRKELNAE